MNNNKRWIILTVCCLINLCAGSLYAWSVFAAPLEEYLNSVNAVPLMAGQISLVFTIAISVGPISMITGGWINDRIGPRWVLFAGGLMYGGGMFVSGLASNIAMVSIAYGLLGGLGGAMIYSCNVSTAIKYFPEKRGLIGGITTASYGISSVLFSKIANVLIESQGVMQSFRILGCIFMVVICGGAFIVGGREKKQQSSVSGVASVENVKKVSNDKDWKQMIRMPQFYLMVAIMMCGAVCGMMCISQASIISQNMMKMSGAAAASIVSLLALFNAGGRVGAGYISDKIGRTNTLLVSSAISIAGLIMLYRSGPESMFIFCAGISMVGIYFGTFMGVYPGFTSDNFGLTYNSVNYGIMFIGFSLAGFIGPTILSKFYEAFGGYQMAFVFAAGCSVAGVGLLLLYRKLFESPKN